MTHKHLIFHDCISIVNQEMHAALTWDTVRNASQGVSKLPRRPGLSLPPNSWVPNNAKVNTKRKRTARRETIERTVSLSSRTKAPNLCQYLKGIMHHALKMSRTKSAPYFVTLKTRSRRTQRRTDTPSGGITSVLVKTTSMILLITTKQSNRLNRETK